MKINKIDYLFKIFLLIFLVGSSDCFKTSFGLLKKSAKKANTNNSSHSQSLSKTNIQKKNSEPTVPAPSADAPPTSSGPSEDTPGNIPTLADQPIYAQGWIKYLHYDDAGKLKPKKFWKNTLFEQENRNTEPDTPDEVIKIC